MSRFKSAKEQNSNLLYANGRELAISIVLICHLKLPIFPQKLPNFHTKVAQFPPKVAQMCPQQKINVFQNSHKVTKILGHFCNKICCQHLKKIAQSGHRDPCPYHASSCCWVERPWYNLMITFDKLTKCRFGRGRVSAKGNSLVRKCSLISFSAGLSINDGWVVKLD